MEKPKVISPNRQHYQNKNSYVENWVQPPHDFRLDQSHSSSRFDQSSMISSNSHRSHASTHQSFRQNTPTTGRTLDDARSSVFSDSTVRSNQSVLVEPINQMNISANQSTTSVDTNGQVPKGIQPKKRMIMRGRGKPRTTNN